MWQLLTHTPCPVSSLAFIKRAECRVGFFQTLPYANVVDWSRETGQSPIVTVTTTKRETDFELLFEKGRVQSFVEWKRKWAEKQQGPGDPLSESESDYSDDDYMSYHYFDDNELSDEENIYCCRHGRRCPYNDDDDCDSGNPYDF